MHALIFAVQEINADPELLPNVTLGFQVYDACNTLRRAAQGTLFMLSGGKGITPNYHCDKGTRLAGIIGESGSTRSILMAQILGLYWYPQISYFASSPILSNRYLFPSFFRTIPSDQFQMKGLAELVFYFGWSWVGLLANDNDYGQFGLQIAKQEIIKGGACVAFTENILTGQPNRNAPHIVQVIKESTAKVVMVISSDSHFVIVAEELLRQNVTGNIWIASEAWATSDLLFKERYQEMLLGTIGFAIHRGKMPTFSKYLRSFQPANDHYDPFIKEYWEQAFSCKWPGQENKIVSSDNASMRVCTGTEKLESLLTEEYHRLSLNVYNAVYAMAWAIQNLLNCTSGAGPFPYGDCANISSFHPWHLLHYIKNVNFKTKDGRQIFFDAKGNPPAIYDIVNWQVNVKGALEPVTIGSYDLSAPNGRTLSIDSAGIIWTNNETQVPLSTCSPRCPLGFRKVIIPGRPLCCYNCAHCPQGYISNQTDAVECQSCSWNMWPNQQQDRCLLRTTEFLSYEEPLGYSLAAIGILSSLIPLNILGVFIHYKQTPIVRANNYSLSCLLLLSLSLCFLCSLGFIGYPQPTQCLLRQVAFGMVFALCISCVLAKTITVVIAFNATKPGSRLRKWTGVKTSYCAIGFCTFLQLVVCVLWLSLSAPFPELDADTKPGVIIVNCNERPPSAFWCMLGYLGLLAFISFIVAFLARRLPDSFNEAKFITFSMLAFLSVWVSFIPAYLSAQGMYTVAMEVFAILSSSWAVVGCIFVPKCYIVLFRPNMNSRENLMGKGKGQK
ncbi:extracellular calcium-sensing receptor [Xenopus laevis]|nr:extracellular calcium-sensing receptor [Xenopus laevis]